MVTALSTTRAAAMRVVLALCVSSCPAHAQSAVTVSIDGTASGAALDRIWPFFGYDEINYSSSPEGEALLRALASSQSAPVHVRSHFWFNTGSGVPAMKWGSTNVYTEGADGKPIYSWELTDGILDSIADSGAHPFVELGFMPQALSTHPDPYLNSSASLLDGGSYYPPTDYVKWANLIREWAGHARARYPDAAQNWLWELWNEPDIGYWNGTSEEYARLYDYTESALHEVIPTAPLGGPAVATVGGKFLKQFLEHCAAGTNAVTGSTGTRLDLVTFHAKGGVAMAGDHVQMNLGNQLRLHRVGFKTVAAFPRYANTPIYITEADPEGCAACPVSSLPANAYRNSTAYGAYELAMMKYSLELGVQTGVRLSGLLTWAFTFPGTPYFAGYRSLSTNGIHLPVFGAFQLLGRLNGSRLPLTSSGARPLDEVLAGGVRGEPTIDGLATRDDAAIRVLVWNYHDDLVPSPSTPVHLMLQVPPSFGTNVQVAHLRVDETHGDAHSVWLAQGQPATPSAAQILALERAMVPKLLEDRAVDATNDVVELDFDLPRFGVSLITVSRADAIPDDPASAASSDCACRVGARSRHSTSSALVLGASALAIAYAMRRAKRSA